MVIGKHTPRVLGEGIVGALTIAGTIVTAPLLRPWYTRWGTTVAEAQARLPGDEYVPRPDSQITCAITIGAPPAQIWPWLVQIGCRRGGWYSYDLLDNGGTPSAATILPEHQHIALGDSIPALPKGDFGFPAAIVEPERTLTLAGTLNTATGQPADGADGTLTRFFSGDQTWVLRPLNGHGTRLIFRSRMAWNPSVLNRLIYRGCVEPISFVMGRKMLRTLKGRAERGAGAEPRALPATDA
jgi:proline iminopeptidase